MLKFLVDLVRISLRAGEATRMAKFALVGLSGVVVNFFCYRLLVAVPGWTVWGAASGATGLAVVNNFIWNEKFTFSETHRATPDGGHVLKRFLAFAMFSAAGSVLNVALVSLLVGRLGVPWVPGLIVGVGLAGLWNFLANSNLTWQAWSDRKTFLKTTDDNFVRQATERES